MEVVKFQQAQLINSDLDMYYARTDTPALCRTSSLVEELGQIEYVFSDKTGTLTRNEMEFQMCSIAGVAYASVVDESKRGDDDDRGGNGTKAWRSFAQMQEMPVRLPRRVGDEVLFLLRKVVHGPRGQLDMERAQKLLFRVLRRQEVGAKAGQRAFM